MGAMATNAVLTLNTLIERNATSKERFKKD
jgi:hypothetical protein